MCLGGCRATAPGTEASGGAGGRAGRDGLGGAAASVSGRTAAGSGGQRASASGADAARAGTAGLAGRAAQGGSAAGAAAAATGAVNSEPVDEASYLFDDAVLRTYNIVIASEDLAKIDEHPSYEESVDAGLEFEGKTYGPYKVRYKGGGGSFRPPCSDGGGPKLGKCSLKLDFNDLDPDARFFGLKKLNLHSMNADSSLLRDRLDYRMFREMGVAAPRAVHARVLINGELEGLYIVVEQIDGVFTRSRFAEGGKGNLYKEIWPMYETADPYVKALETNDEQPNVQHMLDFFAAIQQSKAAAERFYDRDYLMRYLAVDRVTINDDGVVRFSCDETAPKGFDNHNFYWYEEAQSGRMWLVPWDLDKSFLATTDVLVYPAWTSDAACSCTEHPWYGSQLPTHCDALFSQLLAAPEAYARAVDQFVTGPFAKAHVDALLDGWIRQIQPTVSEAAGKNGAPDAAQWQSGVAELRQIIDDARAHRGFDYATATASE